MQVEALCISPHLFCPVLPEGRLIPNKPPCFCDNLLPSPLSLPNSRLLLSVKKFLSGGSFQNIRGVGRNGKQTEVIEGYCNISFTNHRVSPEI